MDPDHPEQCLLRIAIWKSGKDPGKSIFRTAITEVSVKSFQTSFRLPIVELV
jgi:hypothetical protein